MTIAVSADIRSVLVASASGFVGSHVARLLVERERRVRVLLRATSSRKAIDGLPVEVVDVAFANPAFRSPTNSSAPARSCACGGATGRPMPRLIPYRVAYAVASIVGGTRSLLNRRDGMVNKDAIVLANIFRALDNAKARHELGWTPRPLAETVHDAITWFRSRESTLET